RPLCPAFRRGDRRRPRRLARARHAHGKGSGAMSGRSVWAVVPVKPFAAAKQRLAPVLSRAERAEPARLMLEDVLGVLAVCPAPAGLVVVTGDAEARRMASDRGAVVLHDPAGDLNGAVGRAREFVAAEPRSGMVVVPSDLPLLPAALLAT